MPVISSVHLILSNHIHKKATNFAVLSELGRFPLHFDIIKSKIRYWYRLENLGSSFPLLKEAYLDSKSLLQSKIPSWYGSMNFLLQNINGISDLATTTNFRFNRLYRKSIYQFDEEQWRKQRKKQTDGNLCIYICFKTNFGLEKYLLLLKTVSKGKFLLGFTYLHIDFTLNKDGIRVFPVKTEYVTDAPLMKLMMRYTSYSHAHHPKMTVII